MTNSEATLIYRAAIARAIREYHADLRTIFAAWGNPIPPSQDCMSAMGNAWGTCRVKFARADYQLQEARRVIAARAEGIALGEKWRMLCAEFRGY